MVFIDGWGLGVKDRRLNPFLGADLPWFRGLFRGEVLTIESFAGLLPGQPLDGENAVAFLTDCTLGVGGTPQSATGQTTLFTGENAARLVRGHRSAYPRGKLRLLLQERSIFKQVVELGLTATFINAYRHNSYSHLDDRRLSATTLAVMAAGLPLRSLEDLRGGRAVYHDITGESLLETGWDVVPVSAEEAGTSAAVVAAAHHFSLFEYFLTDLAGHEGSRENAVATMERLDRFLGALWRNLDHRTLLVLTSDHGNIEDLSRRGHNANPVPTVMVAKDASRLSDPERSIRDLTDITPFVVSYLRERNYIDQQRASKGGD